MTNRIKLFGVALLAAAATQAQAQAVQFRFNPTVGQVTRYRMTSRQWTAADTAGAPTMQVVMYQTQTVLPMDGANYVVKTSFDSTVMGNGGGGPRGDPLRGMAVTVHQDSHGAVISREVTPPPGLPAFIGNMMTKNNQSNGPNARTWPQGDVSPGYTWTDSVPMSVGQGRNARQVMCHLTWKFDRIDHQGGARVAVITTTVASASSEACAGSGETVYDLDGSRLVTSTMDMTINGQAHVKTLMETLP